MHLIFNLILVAMSPHFFILDMAKKKVVFQTIPNKDANRDTEKLKAKILQITKQPASKESPCYWLGFLAREAEKMGQPLDDYWNSCNTEGIDLDGVSQLLH